MIHLNLQDRTLEIESCHIITFDELGELYNIKDGLVYLTQSTPIYENGQTTEEAELPFTIEQLAIEIADGFPTFPGQDYLKELYSRIGV